MTRLRHLHPSERTKLKEAGCDNCYALTLSKRLKAMGAAKYQNDGDPRTSGPGFGVTTHPSALDQSRKWHQPRVVFVNSMSDLFHAKVPLDFIRDVFDVMAETPQHTYQVLTKRALRAKRIADQLPWPPNVCLGVSVEDSSQFGRVDHLRGIPAAVRFLSCEPLLGNLSPGGSTRRCSSWSRSSSPPDAAQDVRRSAPP